MIDWVSVKPSVTQQVIDMTGLPVSSVRWVDEQGTGTLAGALPIVWLRVSSIVGIGIETEYRTNEGTDNETVTVSGQRQFTLSIRCESFTSDIADPRWSGNIIWALRARLRRSTAILQRAQDGSFGIVDILGVKPLEYIESGRKMSTHVMDILCCTVDNDVDNSIGAGNWIGEALISGPVNNPDGTPISTVSLDVKAD